MTLTDGARNRARQVIAARTGLDFPEQRTPELDRALLHGMRVAQTTDVDAYLAPLEQLRTEARPWTDLISRLVVGETYFFRDRTFEALERSILPELIARRERDGTRRLRLWSAGCSTGEEPYSLAILVDRLLAGRAGWKVTILGTDIDASALASARAGVYREWSLRSTPDWARQHYFRARSDGMLELRADVREMVAFAPLNLMEPPPAPLVVPPMAMDLVLCRNVLMYLTGPARRRATAGLQSALAQDGLLGVSAVEAAAELLLPLEPVHVDGAILFRSALAAAPARACPGGSAYRRRRRPRVAPASPHPAEPSGDALVEQARTQAGRGHLGRARDLCAKALSRDRLDVEAHLLLAAIHQEAGDQAAALHAARSAVYLAPDKPISHFLLGGILIAGGDVDRGRGSMATVVDLLRDAAPADAVPGTEGLAAGQVRAIARSFLEAA